MLLLAWTPVTHNSNRASVHVNVAQDLPTFHSSLHKIIKSSRQLRLQRFFRALLLKNSAQSPSLCTVHHSVYLAEHPDCVLHEKGKR